MNRGEGWEPYPGAASPLQGIAEGAMADKSNPEHEAEARRILSHEGSLEELEYHVKRLKTLLYKLLIENPELKDFNVKEHVPEPLDPGLPLPGIRSIGVPRRGAVLRRFDLERRIALFEKAIELRKAAATVEGEPRSESGVTKPEAATVQSNGNPAEPTSGESTDTLSAQPGKLAKKRGPKPDHETAWRVQKIVARVAPDGDWRSKLAEICDDLDVEKIPCPKRWRKRDGTCRQWSDCLETPLVVKAIEYRLATVRRRSGPPPKTFS
jgi:hypothetical protein